MSDPTRVAVVDLGTNTTGCWWLTFWMAGSGSWSASHRSPGWARTWTPPAGSPTRRWTACATAVAGYRKVMDRHGSPPVIAIATSAMRDADNGEEFREELAREYGIEPQTIPGDREAAADVPRRDERPRARRVAHAGARHRRGQHRVHGRDPGLDTGFRRLHPGRLGPADRALPQDDPPTADPARGAGRARSSRSSTRRCRATCANRRPRASPWPAPPRRSPRSR